MKRLIFLLIVPAILATSILYAATVQVSWNANTESDMSGYNIYQGNVCIGTVQHPLTVFTTQELPDGTYTFSVSAFDTSGNESIRSDAVSIKIDTTAPNKPTGIKAIIAKLLAWLRSLKG
jgi:hypothetical protein